jgi:hypothetical protein
MSIFSLEWRREKKPRLEPGLGVSRLSDPKDSTARNTRPGAEGDKADVWREFRNQFNAMSEEQRKVHRSYWTDWGAWARSKAGKDFRARYVDLATRAGNELGPSESVTPLSYWLEAVAHDAGGVIWDLCRESAILCTHLMHEVLKKPQKKGVGRPPRMTPERIEEAEQLLTLTAAFGGKRGALKKAAKQVYKNISPDLAYDRGRRTLSAYRKFQKTEKRDNN